MGDRNIISDITRYTAFLIGIALILAAATSFMGGLSGVKCFPPGWQLYFFLFGGLFFWYGYKKEDLNNYFGFMRNNIYRAIICFYLSGYLWNTTFQQYDIVRKIGYYSLLVNLGICILNIFGGDKSDNGDHNDCFCCNN